MLMLLLSLSARADSPAAAEPPAVTPAPAEPAMVTPTDSAPTSTSAATEAAPIEIETISLTGSVPVPEVIIFTPRISVREDSAQVLSERIDAQLAEAANNK